MIDDYTEARDDAQQLQVYDFPFLLYRFFQTHLFSYSYNFCTNMPGCYESVSLTTTTPSMIRIAPSSG